MTPEGENPQPVNSILSNSNQTNNFSLQEGWNRLTEEERAILNYEAHRDDVSEQENNDNREKLEASEVASNLLERYRFLTFGEKQKEIFRYDDSEGVWRPDGISFIERTIQSSFNRRSINSHLVNEVLAHIERETGGADKSIFERNDSPYSVLLNGVLNLETGELEDFSPDFYSINKIPVRFDPNADCPNFKSFINEVLSPEDVRGVQEEVGAILRKKYKTKKFSIYLGEPNTGKTTLISTYLIFLGADNVSSVSIQDLASRNPFQIAPLFGKMANIRDDLSKDVIYSAGKLKELTGGFQVQGERKFHDQFNFVNYAYLIFTCNQLPALGEDDDGFFDRVIIRSFNRTFGGHEKPDRNLLDKLTTPDELSGILNWALVGYRRLEQNGWNFTNTATLDATELDYKRKSDPVWAFCEDCIEVESDAAVEKLALYNEFKAWSAKNGIPLKSKDDFYKALPSKVTVTSGYRELVKGQGKKHCYVGIRILNDKKDAPPAPSAPRQETLEQSVQSEQGDSNLMSTENMAQPVKGGTVERVKEGEKESRVSGNNDVATSVQEVMRQ